MDILKGLFKHAVTCKEIEKILKLANRQPQAEKPLAS